MKQQNEPIDMGSTQFDLMNILSDLDDDQFDNQMVLAVTQVEQNFSKTAIMKKTQPNQILNLTFQNCTFGNIGTLNIHVHKN